MRCNSSSVVHDCWTWYRSGKAFVAGLSLAVILAAGVAHAQSVPQRGPQPSSVPPSRTTAPVVAPGAVPAPAVVPATPPNNDIVPLAPPMPSAAASPTLPAPVTNAPAGAAPAPQFGPGTADSSARDGSTPGGAVTLPAVSADAATPIENVTPSQDSAESTLPHDLTPYGMFMSADVIVKAVMLGLLFASVLTWTIWLAKTIELIGVRRRLARAQQTLTAARSLAEATRAASASSPHVNLLIRAVESELRRSPDLDDVDGIKERITARFERIEAGVGRRLMRATGILGTIGATAPFVGLFGTVWGIMNSFIGISKLHTTNLAVVAPGIAEALLATAFGLAAAIPAVVIYNMFARSIANYRALYADASVEILTLVSRDLSQGPPAQSSVFDPRRSAVPAAE
jgi:biopolymer transport protein ExbB